MKRSAFLTKAVMLRWAALLLLLSVSGLGAAQSTSPTLLGVFPNPSTVGQPVVARVQFNQCDGPLGPPSVAVTGTTVTLTLPVRSGPCGVPPSPLELEYLLGALAPGQYTLVFAPTFPAGFPLRPTQSAHFVVFAGANDPVSVPSLDERAVLLAIAAVILIAGLGGARPRA